MISRPLRYILTGFRHEAGFRIYAFDRIEDDRLRTEFKVKADLATSRRYGIRTQELPLLCLALLEHREPNGPQTIIYSEADMCRHAEARASDAAKRKLPHRTASTKQGTAWRSPNVLVVPAVV